MLVLEGRNIARWESIYTPSFAQIQMSKCCYFKKKEVNILGELNLNTLGLAPTCRC